MDDCGVTGSDCTGTETKRANYTGIALGSGDGTFSAIWLENWGNAASDGEEIYDNIVVSKVFVGHAELGSMGGPAPANVILFTQ